LTTDNEQNDPWVNPNLDLPHVDIGITDFAYNHDHYLYGTKKNNMKPILVDTSALIALGNQSDDLHEKARQIQKQLVTMPVQFVTANLVMAEYCNAFSAIKLRPIAITTLESILVSKRWQYIHIDENLMEQFYVL
jgi:hypothetical protein